MISLTRSFQKTQSFGKFFQQKPFEIRNGYYFITISRYAERFQTKFGVDRIKIWNNYNKFLGMLLISTKD